MVSLGRATVGRGSFVGVVASPNAVVEDGAKVLLDTKGAIAFGVALGIVAGAIAWVRLGGRAS